MKLDKIVLAGAAALALAIFGTSSASHAQAPSLDAETQAQFDAAKKVIPGLDPAVFAAAKKEGSITLYRLGYNFEEKFFPEFQKLFPFIKLNQITAPADALVARYGAEARSGRPTADIVMGSLPNAYDDLDKEGLVTHYTPTLADKYKAGSHDGVYYPFNRYQICSAYNTNNVSADDAKILNSWDGMTNPRWKDKAAIVRYGAGGIGLLPYYFIDSTKGPDFLKKVMALNPLIFSSVPAETERLAAGGVDALFFANEANLFQLKNKGAPIQWVCPEPALQLFTFQIIGAKAPDLNAAKLWIEFTQSDDAQQLVMTSLGFSPGRMDIPDVRPVANQPWYKQPTNFYTASWSDIAKAQPDMQAKWDAASKGVKSGD